MMKGHNKVIVGGCLLAFGAGFANTAVVLTTGTAVSHLTGDISQLSMGWIAPSLFTSLEAMLVVAAALSFFCGSFCAGVVIHHPTLDFARPYGRTIMAIGGLFLLSSAIIANVPVLGVSAAAFGCGLQNSLATRFRGIVLRTTHLTGLITDFGINLGMGLRGFRIPLWKIVVPAALCFSFFIGGAASAAACFYSGNPRIDLAGWGYLVAGGFWSLAQRIPSKNA